MIYYSFSTGNFPYRWKTAKVNPLFKKGDVSGPSNYRPNFVVTVLLVSILWKLLNVTFTILCMTFFNWTTWFILDSPVFVQHGNQTALIKQVDDLILILDNNRVSGVLLVDYCNAFDLVDHNLFWLKLEEEPEPGLDAGLDNFSLSRHFHVLQFPWRMTIKRRVFVAIMNGKARVRVRLGLGLGLGSGLVVGLGGYELGLESLLLLLFYFCLFVY